MFRDRIIVERQGVCPAGGRTGQGSGGKERGGNGVGWAWAGWGRPPSRKQCLGPSGQDLQRGQQSRDHEVSRGPGWWGQSVPQPRRSSSSWWATFSSSASMADKLSSSWS